MNKAKIIGDKIKQARKEAGKSQLELAKAADFKSAVAISLIESGQRNIGVEDLKKVADFLKRDVKYFLGENPDEVQIEVALRSQGVTSTSDQEKILDFIEFVKNKHHDK